MQQRLRSAAEAEECSLRLSAAEADECSFEAEAECSLRLRLSVNNNYY